MKKRNPLQKDTIFLPFLNTPKAFRLTLTLRTKTLGQLITGTRGEREPRRSKLGRSATRGDSQRAPNYGTGPEKMSTHCKLTVWSTVSDSEPGEPRLPGPPAVAVMVTVSLSLRRRRGWAPLMTRHLRRENPTRQTKRSGLRDGGGRGRGAMRTRRGCSSSFAGAPSCWL